MLMMWNPLTSIKRHIAIWQMAKFFSRIDRNPVTRTPEEVGLTFENVDFQTEDGVNLKAWYIPSTKNETSNKKKKLVVFNHFMLGNRAGAVPNADWGNVAVDFMPIYTALVEAGYSVFTYDLRNHGESDLVNGGALGLTHTEYKDALAATRYVKEHYASDDTDSTDLFLYSQCYGAVATMRAIAKSPADFEEYKAFVNLQPLSADAFVTGVTTQFDIYDPSNVELFSRHLENRTGYAVSELKVPDLAPAIKLPTLLTQVHKDFRTTASDIEAVYENLGTDDKKLLWIEDETERLEGYNYFARKPNELIEWLDKY